MSTARKSALVVATSIGANEGLKDQGICRWNGVLKSIQQCAKKYNIGSFSQANKIATESCSLVAVSKIRDESLTQSEESLKKVMYLSAWGP